MADGLACGGDLHSWTTHLSLALSFSFTKMWGACGEWVGVLDLCSLFFDNAIWVSIMRISHTILYIPIG